MEGSCLKFFLLATDKLRHESNLKISNLQYNGQTL